MSDGDDRSALETLRDVLTDAADRAERKLSIYRDAISAIDSGSVIVNGGTFHRMFMQLTEEARLINDFEADTYRVLRKVFGSQEPVGSA